MLDVEVPLQDDSLVGGNTSLTAELRFDSEQIPFLDGAEVSFEVADNDEQPVVVVPDPIVTIRSLTSPKAESKCPTLVKVTRCNW